MNYLGIDYGEVNYGFAIGNSITKNSTTYFSEKIASEKEALKFIENYLEVFFPVYSSNGSHFDDNSYSNKIRFVFTFDPENLTSLFTRRWF